MNDKTAARVWKILSQDTEKIPQMQKEATTKRFSESLVLQNRKRRHRDYQIKHGGWGARQRPRMKLRKNPSDLSFTSLVAYFRDNTLARYNWVFPIDTSWFYK